MYCKNDRSKLYYRLFSAPIVLRGRATEIDIRSPSPNVCVLSAFWLCDLITPQQSSYEYKDCV